MRWLIGNFFGERVRECDGTSIPRCCAVVEEWSLGIGTVLEVEVIGTRIRHFEKVQHYAVRLPNVALLPPL